MACLASVVDALARFGGGSEWGHGRALWLVPLMLVLVAILVTLFVVVVYLLARSFYRNELVPRKSIPETPLEIVKRRYAAGEISSEEFEKVKQDLRESEG